MSYPIHISCGGHNITITEANASLLAAAPKLLAACEALVALDVENNGATDEWPQMIEASRLARIAIDAAKGEPCPPQPTL